MEVYCPPFYRCTFEPPPNEQVVQGLGLFVGAIVILVIVGLLYAYHTRK